MSSQTLMSDGTFKHKCPAFSYYLSAKAIDRGVTLHAKDVVGVDCRLLIGYL